MTRKFTPLYTSIWQDADFTALRPESQALYFALISQPNINSIGLLPITAKRWRSLGQWHEMEFDMALGELEAKAFIVVDHDTEELWVRTFIKWDGGVNHSLRLKAILKDAKAIQSLSLRHSIGLELVRLGVTGIGTQEPPPSHPKGTQVPTVPMSSYVTTVGTLNHEHEPGEVNDSQSEPSQFCEAHQPYGTDQPCAKCARRRVVYPMQLSDRAKRQQDARESAAAARDACDLCNDKGWLEDDAGNPTKRCTHPDVPAHRSETAS